MDISEIYSIHYFYNDNTTRTVVLPGNRITLIQLLNLCNANGGIRHVTVVTHRHRPVNLGIRKAKKLFTDGEISDF